MKYGISESQKTSDPPLSQIITKFEYLHSSDSAKKSYSAKKKREEVRG